MDLTNVIEEMKEELRQQMIALEKGNSYFHLSYMNNYHLDFAYCNGCDEIIEYDEKNDSRFINKTTSTYSSNFNYVECKECGKIISKKSTFSYCVSKMIYNEEDNNLYRILVTMENDFADSISFDKADIFNMVNSYNIEKVDFIRWCDITDLTDYRTLRKQIESKIDIGDYINDFACSYNSKDNVSIDYVKLVCYSLIKTEKIERIKYAFKYRELYKFISIVLDELIPLLLKTNATWVNKEIKSIVSEVNLQLSKKLDDNNAADEILQTPLQFLNFSEDIKGLRNYRLYCKNNKISNTDNINRTDMLLTKIIGDKLFKKINKIRARNSSLTSEILCKWFIIKAANTPYDIEKLLSNAINGEYELTYDEWTKRCFLDIRSVVDFNKKTRSQYQKGKDSANGKDNGYSYFEGSYRSYDETFANVDNEPFMTEDDLSYPIDSAEVFLDVCDKATICTQIYRFIKRGIITLNISATQNKAYIIFDKKVIAEYEWR